MDHNGEPVKGLSDMWSAGVVGDSKAVCFGLFSLEYPRPFTLFHIHVIHIHCICIVQKIEEQVIDHCYVAFT